MYWILAAILLLITLTSPRLRPAGAVGLAILVLLLGWGMLERMRERDSLGREAPQRERTQPSSAVAPPTSVALTEVRMEAPALTGRGSPFELRGRIVNEAHDVRLTSVTIRITREDCYEGALDPSGCVVLWQDQHWTPISVPPQQAREFDTSIWVRGSALRARGQVRDSFELVAAAGEKVAQESAGQMRKSTPAGARERAGEGALTEPAKEGVH